jgi:serine phosphatase RsbU (regulator of sigma subunit)
MLASLKIRKNPLLLANIFSWVFLITINTSFYLILSLRNKTWLLDFDGYLKGVLINIFLLITFFYHRYQLERFKEKDSSELLNKIFYVSFSSIAISFITFLLFFFTSSSFFEGNLNQLNWFYLISILLMCNFLTYTFFSFRVLIFRQAPKYVIWAWNAFIYVFFASLIFNFFDFPFFSLPYISILTVLILISLVFCANMHWVAYLDTSAKLRNIGTLILILCITSYFAYILFYYYDKNVVKADFGYSLYIVGLLSFVLIYTSMAILVLIFNIPTTAVYKKKIDEILAFQQLTQSLQVGDSEESIYEAFLENAVNVTRADAGYIEVLKENALPHLVLKNLDHQRTTGIRLVLLEKQIKRLEEDTNIDGFESLMVQSLYDKKQQKIGELVLLKFQEEGFNHEQEDLLTTFAKQVSISIENYRLLGQVIEKEKLQQELDIAEKVQKSLLPTNLKFNEQIDIYAFSESAKSVGGDYYDIFKVTPTRTYIVIGDVSGKGTSAAFNMAQMKGIFQSLAQLDMPPEYFLLYANQAVSQCFEKASFITITLLLIDTQKQSLTMARAGHCPTLYYNAQTKTVDYIQDKGLGLGIMRNKAYTKFIATTQVHYSTGDILFLYTDGISEAKNTKDDEYGYDLLKSTFAKNIHLPIETIQTHIISDVHQFCEGLPPQDDYTSLIIRFL